jgi:putative tricarboxylic transport membrane protein
MIEAFLHAAGQIADPTVMAVIFFGSLFGLILGLMPGLGAVQGLALALPFTFGWDPLVAMFFYAGIMGSVSEGGAVTAILLNTPGTPINAASCFDGYPMARRGEAGRALGLAAASSALGALFGIIVLIALIPLVRPIVLSFGPPEFFWLILFGLVTITFAARGNLFKGLAAGGVGILVSLVGYRDLFNVTRWTGGSEYLWEGVPLVPFFIGVFAISELIIYTTKGGTIARVKAERIEVKGMRQVFQGVREMFDYPVTFLRGSVIGTIVGIIPGIGGAVANFISYTSAMQASKNPALFGQGNPEGLVASESANDAKDGGSLLPTLAFGIPGSVEMAVFLGALILHGVQPGPLLIHYHLDIVATVILGLVVSNVLAGIFLIFLAYHLARITFVPVYYIAPGTLILSALGSFALRGNVWDIGIMALAGILGFLMKRFGFPVITFAIGFILGDLAEEAFHQSLMIAYGSYSIFFTRPISVILMLLIIVVLVLPCIKFMVRRREMAWERSERPFKLDTGSVVFTAALLLIVLGMVMVSLVYRPSARLVPLVVGVPTLLLLLVSLLAEFSPASLKALEMGIETLWGGSLPRSEDAGVEDDRTRFNRVRLFRVIGWILGFLLVLFPLGLLTSTGAFLSSFLIIEGKAHWLKSIGITAAVLLLLYYVVQDALMLKLWPGALPEIIPGIVGGGIVPPL